MKFVAWIVVILCIPVVANGQEPWLPEAEQARLKKLWPTNVDFPEGLKFYKLDRAYQFQSTTNRIPNLGFMTIEYDYLGKKNINRDAQWYTPGGLDTVSAGEWDNATALAIPRDKKIKVFIIHTDVPEAVTKLPKYDWSFPTDTITIDMLINTKLNTAFEVRRRTKTVKGWLDSRPFVERKSFPAGYTGPGRKCAECHDYAGGSASYAINLSGADTTFSWYPASVSSVSMLGYNGKANRQFYDSNKQVVLDNRWPLVWEKQ